MRINDESARSWIDSVGRNWRNPIWWRDRLLYKYVFPRIFPQGGIDVVSQDWDNLVILDACRFDTFKEVSSELGLGGELRSVISRGSSTTSFLRRNFGRRDLDQIVYVTANPFVNKLLPRTFYKIVSVWDWGWNEEEGTVLPNTVCKAAIEARRSYPNKRLIIHFMQPHYPYIGSIFRDRSSLDQLRSGVKEGTFTMPERGVRDSLLTMCSMGVFAYAIRNPKPLLEAYKSNLRGALFALRDVLDLLGGRTVLTSDHGEAFGEKLHRWIPIRVYGHFPEVRIRALIQVPWFIPSEPDRDRGTFMPGDTSSDQSGGEKTG